MKQEDPIPPGAARSIRRRKIVHWVLELNLWIWVALLVYFAARGEWDRQSVMAAGGLFIAACVQFLSNRYLYAPALRDEARYRQAARK